MNRTRNRVFDRSSQMTTSGDRTSGKTVGAMLVLLLVPAVALAGDKLPMARHLAAPQYVTANTRAELDARMAHHGEDMSNLVRAVVLLDRPTIRTLANRLADEEVIAYNDRSAADRLDLPSEFLIQQT